jgi:hypothetical protein
MLKGFAYPVSSTYPIPFTGRVATEPLADTLPSQYVTPVLADVCISWSDKFATTVN